jgi:hypothetical protein
MDIRVGSIQPDSTRYSDASAKKRKRPKSEAHHEVREEEVWSERSDYEEIEDCYTPSDRVGSE